MSRIPSFKGSSLCVRTEGDTSHTYLFTISTVSSQQKHTDHKLLVFVPLRQQSVMGKIPRLVCIFAVVSIFGLDSI